MAARKTKALSRTNQSAVALPENLQEKLGKFINRDRATSRSAGWSYISASGAGVRLRLEDRPIGDETTGEVEVIILGGVRINTLYEGPYQQDNPQAPVCFAVAKVAWEAGEAEDLLAPPPGLPGTPPGVTKCSECPLNRFGSDPDGGRGKACKNQVRLALIPENSSDYSKADGFLLNVPPTSLKGWSRYIAHVNDGLSRPAFGLVTRIRKVPNETAQGFKFSFEGGRLLDVADIEDLIGRAEGDAEAALEQLPSLEADSGGDAPKSRGPQRRKVSRKKSAAKRR